LAPFLDFSLGYLPDSFSFRFSFISIKFCSTHFSKIYFVQFFILLFTFCFLFHFNFPLWDFSFPIPLMSFYLRKNFDTYRYLFLPFFLTSSSPLCAHCSSSFTPSWVVMFYYCLWLRDGLIAVPTKAFNHFIVCRTAWDRREWVARKQLLMLTCRAS
jgi:hypothetical protein